MLGILAVSLVVSVDAHGALTFPRPRNAVDGDLAPWTNWAYPCDESHEGADCAIQFCEGSKGCQGACPISAHNGREMALNASNGQACYWFSNGCTIGCEKCDGTHNHFGPHGGQHFLYKGMTPAELRQKNMTIDNPWNPPEGFTLDPKSKFGIKSMCDSPSTNATMCDPLLRTANSQAKCGSPEDIYYYSPWRAPGSAPVIDPCGVAGGRLPGEGMGQAGASFQNSSVAKMGDMGSKLPPLHSGAVWEAGSNVEVGWTVMANHGGGYAYRLAPADVLLTEEAFRQMALDFVGPSILRWDGNVTSQLAFDPKKLGWETSHGTTPQGSTWRKNPIPSGIWQREGATFDPVCTESEACKRAVATGGIDQHMGASADASLQGVCRCSHFSNGGYLLPNLEVVDNVRIPKDLKAGHYVLQWRWDCEETDQIWTSCSDVMVEAPPNDVVV